MRLYLDTCIANDLFVINQALNGERLGRRDVKFPIVKWVTEYVALYYLLDLDEQWQLEFGTSQVMKGEIHRIRAISSPPVHKKSVLLDICDLLLEKAQLTEHTRAPAELRDEVSRTIPHQRDVDHVCSAIMGKWDYLITTDFEGILGHRGSLQLLGIAAASPREFIERHFIPLETLVRTLHGSWTTLQTVVESLAVAIQSSLEREDD